MQRPLFRDRSDAGRRLAQRLSNLRGQPEIAVLALPRGGVPVGYEVATYLHAPLYVFVVRKLGVPGHEEFAMGAVASGGVRVVNTDVIRQLGISEHAFEQVAARELAELERRDRLYSGRPFPSLKSATVVLVDDGIATGATMAAAIAAVRQQGVAQVIVAAPVISKDALEALSAMCDRCECVAAPEPFGGVGLWYGDFAQTTDAEVQALQARAGGASARSVPPISRASTRAVRISVGDAMLHGDLVLPRRRVGIVVFAHGSGSSRFSPRNQEVATALNIAGYATLLFDLLTSQEEAVDRVSGALRFDIGFLGARLISVTDWITSQADLIDLPVGYFGASTGAAAALVAAAARPERVRAVVSRGGRPDLAGDALPRVKAPTLLIVGENDPQVLALNRAARLHLRSADTELAIIPRATHLFEEPGALAKVSRVAEEWFDKHLATELAGSAAG
jgi:putative phosphoribosyl transferase